MGGVPSEVDPITNKLGVNTFNTLPISPNPVWEQRWSMDVSAMPQLAGGGNLASVYGQGKFLLDDSMTTPLTGPPDHWNDPYSPADLMAISSAFKQPFPEASPSERSDSQSPTLTAKKEEHQKRKRCSNGNSIRKSMRRDFSRDSKVNMVTGGGTNRSNSPRGTHSRHDSEDSGQQGNNHSRHIKERNRIASGKFRAKKREDTLRLESEEQEMERINRNLSICKADLTREVHELKMKLLQHFDCDCSLIHDYIAAEAQRYIRELDRASHLGTPSPDVTCNR